MKIFKFHTTKLISLKNKLKNLLKIPVLLNFLLSRLAAKQRYG